MRTDNPNDKLFKSGIYLFCLIVLILTGFPLVFLAFNSFRSLPEYMMSIGKPPMKIFLENYKFVFSPTFLRYFGSSLIVSVSSVCVVVLVSSLMSYIFAKFSFRITKGLFFPVIAGMIDTRSKKTLSLGFQTINIPAGLTAILVGSLPVLVFYFIAQDKVINGLTQGALKG